MQHGTALRKLWTRYQTKEAPSVHCTKESTSYDLYVGDLDFKADAEDLFDSIHPLSRRGTGISLETTTVPLRKSCNRGYGFIKLSRDKDEPIDPDDICTRFTGTAKANSRQVYLCETNDTSSACLPASDRSGSDSGDISTASESTARDRLESESDEPTRALFATYGKPAFQYRSSGYDSDCFCRRLPERRGLVRYNNDK